MWSSTRRGIIKYDLCQGLRANMWKFLAGTVPFFGVVMIVQERSVLFSAEPSFFEYFIYLFKGIRNYTPIPGQQFEVPILWMIVQVSMALIVYDYPVVNLEKYGIQTIIRAKSRALWWFSKCIWVVASVVLYYAVGILIILGACMLTGKISFIADQEWNMVMNELDVSLITHEQLWLICIYIPLMSSIALSLLQLTGSFVLSPVYSFLLLLSYIVISVYYNHSCFMGANSMILRSEFAMPGGNTLSGIVITNIIVMCAAAFGGYIYFRRHDIY